ncbi:hypothetical protein H8E77_14225 [bacterium]|nr:hypothetical protein [bacterium]
MIQNVNELEVCKRRLLSLQARIEQIVTHPQKSRRAKEMELAGVRGMVHHLKQELQTFELSQFQQPIHTIKAELQEGHPENQTWIVQKK